MTIASAAAGHGSGRLRRRGALLATCMGSLVFVTLFLLFFRPNVGAIAGMLAAAPWWIYLAVAAIELAIMLAAAEKWRISTRHFRPGVPPRTLLQSLEATAAGSLLGQIMPPQLGVAGARAALESRSGGSGMAVWTTFHEQSFDLVALCAIGSVAAFALISGAGPIIALGLCGIMALTSLACAQLIFRLLAQLVRLAANRAPRRIAKPAGTMGGLLAEAASAPWHVPASLLALSLLRVVLLAARALVVLAVVSPNASLYWAALGFPVVQFMAALPIAGSGVGFVEWGWTEVLHKAGLAAQAAADAAVVLRVVSLAAFALILVALVLHRCLQRIARLQEPPAAPSIADRIHNAS